MTILGGELIRQPDAPIRPVLIPLPATWEAENADQSVTSNVGINKRSDSERRGRFSALLLSKSTAHVKDTERQAQARRACDSRLQDPRQPALPGAFC